MDNQEKFKGIFQLLKESWEIYQSKILLGIMIFPVGFSFGPFFKDDSESLSNRRRKTT